MSFKDRFARRWDAIWQSVPTTAEPTPLLASPIAESRASTNVVYLPASEPTPKPANSAISVISRKPRELAKQHALALLRHLISTMADVPAEHRLLTTCQMQQRYAELCVATNAVPRKWNTVATFFNRLIRQDGKPLKPYLDLADPATEELRKCRVYAIPFREPADWQRRLDGRASRRANN